MKLTNQTRCLVGGITKIVIEFEEFEANWIKNVLANARPEDLIGETFGKLIERAPEKWS
jgi:hypothetical protein